MERRSWVEWVLVAVVVVGLAIGAYVHLHLAGGYALVRTRFVSQATLFRIEGAVAIVAAVLLIVWRSWIPAAIAFVVAAGGAGAVVLYEVVDPGRLGPFPDMYEPVWYAEKTWSVDAEAVAALAALALLVLRLRRRAATAAA